MSTHRLSEGTRSSTMPDPNNSDDQRKDHEPEFTSADRSKAWWPIDRVGRAAYMPPLQVPEYSLL